jgi:hypothetical protein
LSPAHPLPRCPVAIAESLRKILAALFDPYRPERHYMRGPGPRWHAKHGDVVPVPAYSRPPKR